MPTVRPGKKLEALVAALERVLNKTGAKIEAPSRRLIDRDTGEPREHDVLITWDHGHHQIVAAIECRDRSRPVGVPEVEAFADKCDATGVQHRVIVSAAGFCKTARTKAQVRGITCMDLSEVETFEWLGTNTFTGYTRHIKKVHFSICAPLSRETFGGALYDPKGRKVSVEQLARIALSRLPDADVNELQIGTPVTVAVPLLTPGWSVLGKDGAKHTIDQISAEITSELTKTEMPITKHHYTGGGKDYAFASAESPMANMPGHIMMMQNQDGSTSIFFVPKKSIHS